MSKVVLLSFMFKDLSTYPCDSLNGKQRHVLKLYHASSFKVSFVQHNITDTDTAANVMEVNVSVSRYRAI